MRPKALELLLQHNLTAADFKVLFALCYFCTWTNRVELSKKLIVSATGLAPKTVYNSLTKLHLLRLIMLEQGTGGGAAFIYPELCWRGYTEQLPSAIARWNEQWATYLQRVETA
jgi:predicted transcriptional regulator